MLQKRKVGDCRLSALAPMVLLAAAVAAVAAPDAWLNITPGGSASQLCFSWATASASTPKVQIVKASGSDTATFAGVCLPAFYGAAGADSAGWFQNKVTVDGLAPSACYAYRVGDGATWSDFHSVHTRDNAAFRFIAVGDPQLGAATSGPLEPLDQAKNALEYHAAGWRNTLAAAARTVPDAAFLVSLGDQIDNTTSLPAANAQYDAYFRPPQLRGLPVAAIDGNHDYGLGSYYGFHYNLPHQSRSGATTCGNDGDYWFAYGPALFMVINSNAAGAAAHDVFIGQALAADPRARWRIVMLHHSIYSNGNHATKDDILSRRNAYVPVFDKYHIDVVLAGHDHMYTRSFQMLGDMAVSAKADSIVAVNPKGTLYMTLNSGSGSKYYQLNPDFVVNGRPVYPYYTQRFWQRNEPTFSRVAVTADAFSIVTFAVPGDNRIAPIDSYTIVKTGDR